MKENQLKLVGSKFKHSDKPNFNSLAYEGKKYDGVNGMIIPKISERVETQPQTLIRYNALRLNHDGTYDQDEIFVYRVEGNVPSVFSAKIAEKDSLYTLTKLIHQKCKDDSVDNKGIYGLIRDIAHLSKNVTEAQLLSRIWNQPQRINLKPVGA